MSKKEVLLRMKKVLEELIPDLQELQKRILKSETFLDNKKAHSNRPRLTHRGEKMSRNKKILILYKKGMTGTEIAARFNITSGRVYHILKKMKGR